jgi:prepilin-type N-terminal cleavage/methylation domain-containing protein
MNAALGSAIAPARPEGRRAGGRRYGGFTLLELLIVLALLAIPLAVAGPAFVARRPSEDTPGLEALRAARTEAIRTGTITIWEHDGQRLVFLPDGSSSGGTVVVGRHRLVVDPLNGATRAAE